MNKQINSGPGRREFLKSSAVVAAASTIPQIAGAFAGGDDEIKIGLVGCGGKGTSDVRQALSTNGKVKLWALGDSFRSNAERSYESLTSVENFADKIDCKDRIFDGFDAYKQVIDSGVDVVFLVTTPGFRPQHYEYAIQQGKHVFMQKPCAVDPRGVRMLEATNKVALEKGLKVGVGFQRRHDERYIETVKRLQDGAIGEMVLFRAYWDGNTPWVRKREEGETEMEYQMKNWYYFNWLCGDHILEQHVHNIDVCNWIMGATPDLAQGKGGCEVRKGPDYGETFDHHQVEFVYGKKWDHGIRMHSSCRHIKNTWKQVSEFVHGTEGFCMIAGGKIFDNKGVEVWRAEKAGNSEQSQKQKFFDAIRNNGEFHEGDFGASSSMTAIMGRMCTYSGQLLRYEDSKNSEIDVFPYDQELAWDGPTPVNPGPDGLYPHPIPGVTKVI